MKIPLFDYNILAKALDVGQIKGDILFADEKHSFLDSFCKHYELFASISSVPHCEDLLKYYRSYGHNRMYKKVRRYACLMGANFGAIVSRQEKINLSDIEQWNGSIGKCYQYDVDAIFSCIVRFGCATAENLEQMLRIEHN